MKTKHTVLAMLLLIPVAGVSGLATSASFEQLDANKDGQVSADEAGKDLELTKMWSTVDTNQDGAIDRTEFSAFENLQREPKVSESRQVPSGEFGGSMY